MSELNRLRELAALLQPKPVTEARVKTRADLEKKFDSVQATVTDLADDLSEGGVLETLLDDVGMSDHKDAAGLLKTLDSAVKTIQSALMEVEGLLFSAMTESRHPGPVTEMAKASEYRGGAFDRKRAKQMIASFKGKEDTFELEDGSEYEATKMASGGNLKKGDVVFAVHDKYNTGAELYEILGFGKDDKVVYDSMKDVYAKTGVKTLKELEKFNDANDDKEVRMIVKDLDDGSSGDWFYVFEGRWAYGSGGEPLSFMGVKKIKDATVKEALSVGDSVEFADDSVTKLVGKIKHVIKKGDKVPSGVKAYSAYDKLGGAKDHQDVADYKGLYLISACPKGKDCEERLIALPMYRNPKKLSEAKNHMDENTYQSVASWKRALKAKYGMGVRYVAHEGTIDAFAGEKDDIKKERQVGDWDDTTGTVY
jgi:hypothetical protein